MNADTTPRLGTLPVAFAATVAELHRVAEEVVSPGAQAGQRDRADGDTRRVRHAGVRHGGVRQQVRVDGAELVHEPVARSGAPR